MDGLDISAGRDRLSALPLICAQESCNLPKLHLTGETKNTHNCLGANQWMSDSAAVSLPPIYLIMGITVVHHYLF